MTTRTKTKLAAGTKYIHGNATRFHAVFYVKTANGEGSDIFGSDAEASVFSHGLTDVREYDFRVSIGGLSAHGTELGRKRAENYLTACDIADALEAVITKGGYGVAEAFVKVAEGLGLEVHRFEEDGVLTGAQAERYEA